MVFEPAVTVLRDCLIGNAFTTVSVGDWWALSFDRGFWVVAQELAFPETPTISALLEKADPPVLDGVDPDRVAQAVVIMRNLRRPVTDVSLSSDGALNLAFGDRQMSVTTGTDVVDWQWCLNRSGADPYSDFIVACFWPGQVQVSEGSET